MNLKNKETIFTIDGACDKKSKLNRLNKRVNSEYLDRIEGGVTIEDLDEMAKDGLPILKYKTQITIHGLFPEIDNNYIYGYKNVFQNKNKSIGVKYNAIDEEKRRRIQEKVKIVGWRYNRTSTSIYFEKVLVANDRGQVAEKIKTLKEESDKIDEGLFYGNKSLFYGEYWGRYYIILRLGIGAVYECDIDTLISQMGWSEDVEREVITKQEKERSEREQYWAAERAKSEAAKEEQVKSKASELEKLKELPRVERTESCGKFIRKKFNYNDELVFVACYVYLPKGKRVKRINETEYKTVDEAMNHEFTERYSDRVWRGKVTGHKLEMADVSA